MKGMLDWGINSELWDERKENFVLIWISVRYFKQLEKQKGQKKKRLNFSHCPIFSLHNVGV